MQNSGQSTSPAGAAVEMMPVTGTTLVLIAIAAVATILMIWWGTRLLRARRDAVGGLEEDGYLDRVGSAPDDAAGDGTSDVPDAVDGDPGDVAVAAAPGMEPIPVVAPTAPAPPPLADGPAVATAPASVAAPERTPDATPAPVARDAPSAASADDLTVLKGVGPKVASELRARGITGFAALAALSPQQAEALDAQLGVFRGRMFRDRWIDQARYLANGDRAGFEQEFGKL